MVAPPITCFMKTRSPRTACNITMATTKKGVCLPGFNQNLSSNHSVQVFLLYNADIIFSLTLAVTQLFKLLVCEENILEFNWLKAVKSY